MSRLLTTPPAAIVRTSNGVTIAFGETDPAHFTPRITAEDGKVIQRGTMIARVYSPDEFEDSWRLVWFEMNWGRLRAIEHEPDEGWLYTQVSKRYLEAAEVDYCLGLLETTV
jgi:hypothetical protein